jgi:histidinol phosphatase-like enzyme
MFGVITFYYVPVLISNKKGLPGTDVMIFKIFSPKNSAKKLAFLTQNKAKLCKILIITLVYEKNANFFTENCRKSQKIVIITSTPAVT